VADVQWLGKAYDFAFNKGKIPMSPKIGNILNKSKRVRAFHITSPEKLSQLNSLQGTKKSISCMQHIPDTAFRGNKITGIWHNGVLFYLEGTLLVKAKRDIMSEPDEQGRRWVLLPSRYRSRWEDVVAKDKEMRHLDRQMRGQIEPDKAVVKKYGDNWKNYLLHKKLYRYIKLAEWFVKQDSLGIADEYIDDLDVFMSDWDEILLNDIKLIDAIWDGREGDKTKIIPQLKSMVSGKVDTPYRYDDSDGEHFVRIRKVK
jgi:hypothetical protein